jgi:signal transduction histidine kinase
MQKRSRSLLRSYADTLVAVVLGGLYVLEELFEADLAGHRPQAVLCAIGFGVALAFRRRLPVVTLAAALAVIVLDNTLVRGLAEAGAFLFGVVLALYSAGRYARGKQLVACGLLVAASIPFAAIEPGQAVSFADFAFFIMFFGGPFVAGRIIRARREREAELVTHATALELTQEERARAAVAEERTRIARELHDVVSHGISVMVLQARGGRRLLETEPAATREALDTIEAAGEQALTEMRRLLGLLRADDEALALAPQPSLARIDDLAERMRATGLPVEVTVEGEPVALPQGVDVSAYRIVQEALTNALKHAGNARAHVVIRYRPDTLDIEVLDDGPGDGDGGGSGHGLAGIRERVGIYGGELESGARPDGGYALRARLPLPAR